MQPSCIWLCFHATQIPLALEAETPKRDRALSCSPTGKESSNVASVPASTNLCLLPAEKSSQASSWGPDQTEHHNRRGHRITDTQKEWAQILFLKLKRIKLAPSASSPGSFPVLDSGVCSQDNNYLSHHVAFHTLLTQNTKTNPDSPEIFSLKSLVTDSNYHLHPCLGFRPTNSGKSVWLTHSSVAWPIIGALSTCRSKANTSESHFTSEEHFQLTPPLDFFPFWDNLMYPGWLLTCYLAEDGLKLLVLLPPPPKWELRSSCHHEMSPRLKSLLS